MKVFLATLSGFILTLAIFAAGAIFAIYFTSAEPVPVWTVDQGASSAWTVEPVSASSAPFQRVPARPATPSSTPSVAAKNTDAPPLDVITTGALTNEKPEAPPEPTASEEASLAHVQWCLERYRSYRREDNSYRSYSGSQRECVSPFNKTLSSQDDEQVDTFGATSDRPQVGFAVYEEGPPTYLTPRHIASCFARYRSYRPEDNSYQPYRGGPRRQCD
ncbi:BA14K family protein [Mesorhizobium sp. IMUNJ 23232]|uniref:BA14K family protein n=1 Tax=Mesorhizobium sp. IMUNJ 23232 TaxID=3376064 RepID=UPI00379DB8D1